MVSGLVRARRLLPPRRNSDVQIAAGLDRRALLFRRQPSSNTARRMARAVSARASAEVTLRPFDPHGASSRQRPARAARRPTRSTRCIEPLSDLSARALSAGGEGRAWPAATLCHGRRRSVPQRFQEEGRYQASPPSGPRLRVAAESRRRQRARRSGFRAPVVFAPGGTSSATTRP